MLKISYHLNKAHIHIFLFPIEFLYDGMNPFWKLHDTYTKYMMGNTNRSHIYMHVDVKYTKVVYRSVLYQGIFWCIVTYSQEINVLPHVNHYKCIDHKR